MYDGRLLSRNQLLLQMKYCVNSSVGLNSGTKGNDSEGEK